MAEETWLCTECSYENEPQHTSCQCCGFPKDGEPIEWRRNEQNEDDKQDAGLA